MKITLLGTGAAEAIPDPFCKCAVCVTARDVKGRHIRGRSTALVNDDLLLDCGPDLLTGANQAGLFLGAVHTLLLTHGHEDHWLYGNLSWRRTGFTPTPLVPMAIYGPADALQMTPQDLCEPAQITLHPVAPGVSWQSEQYRITAVPATHGNGFIEALLYVIDDDQQRLFYATDTSSLSEHAWDILRTLGPMSTIILDATSGLRSGGQAHHGIAQFMATRDRFIKEGVMIPAQTILVAHHFSHNGGLTHYELVDIYSREGVIVAYDGMVLN